LVWGKGIRAANGTPTEKEESFGYKVRVPFTATMSCERERADAACSPLSGLSLSFSAPFDAKFLKQFQLITPEGTRTPMPAEEQEGTRHSTLDAVRFAGPLTQNSELRIELPSGFKDDSNRPLANASSFPLKTRTAGLPPLAKFAGDFGILEHKQGGLLPVTLRNVETSLKTRQQSLPGAHHMNQQRINDDAEVIATMRALEKFERQSRTVKINDNGQTRELTDSYYARELSFLKNRKDVVRQELPKPGASSEFEVIGIPLQKPGYHIVEIESQLLGTALLSTPKPMYVRTAALVTNMGVHLKTGHTNALVWVTALDTGKPVSGAKVRISGCNGASLWEGQTDAQGRAHVEQSIREPRCSDGSFLLASARLGEDFSFVRSDWNQGIEPWRFGVEGWYASERLRIHSILDRTLLRTGQMVSVKHVARSRGASLFTFPESDVLPNKLMIRHSDTGTEYTQDLKWDAQASATSSWKVPESAKLGTYEMMLTGGKSGTQYVGEFRVADFRLPVFTGSIQGVSTREVGLDTVPLALGLSFLNGGAAKNTPVQVSATLRPRWPSYKGYEGFNFQVDMDDEGLAAFKVESTSTDEKLILDRQSLTLDKTGGGKLSVELPNKPKGPSELYAEMTFSDPNGEVQTIHGSVPLWPANVTVGIKVADWASSNSKNRIEVVVLDLNGKPLPNQSVSVTAKRRVDYSHRRRIVGGFYAYENQQEYQNIGEVCAGKTDSRGLLLCEPSISEAGSIYLLAQARDNQGNTARASASYWLTAKGDLWFTAGNQDRIDVIPEKRNYQPGETARIQVRTPFRDATALIAIEADGILETLVQPLSRYKPTVEIAVRPEWGPNVYISVLAVRGRVEPLTWLSFFQWGWREPLSWLKEWWAPDQPTAMVDLAKPAYRFGIGNIRVGTEGFKLKVDVTTDKTDYRPREQATVRLRVTTPDGQPAPAGSEVAFAAVDQALLELKPNDTWDLLSAMMQERGYAVQTSTAQSQIIGKRHFGKKALPPGGGGGRAPARELFDTLLSWQPRIKLDSNGQASFKITLNDSLSEFRLVGVATAGSSLFGTGSTSVRTKQDLQLISGLPPLVREGDAYTAVLTVRNGTARKMSVNVQAQQDEVRLPEQNLQLEPEGSSELRWDVKASDGISRQTWSFSAQEKGGAAQDAMKIEQQISPAVPVTVQQAQFMRIEAPLELGVTLPNGALQGKGGLQISLSPKLAVVPPGVTRYFENYPFSCLEQQTSIAVGLADGTRWNAVANNLPGLIDSNGLASYFPGTPGSVTLTAYVMDLTSLAGFSLPIETKQRMLQGLTAYVEGRTKTNEWSPSSEASLYRRLNALQALTRQGEKPIRTVAALEVDTLKLPTAALIDWYLIVQRLNDLPQRDKKLADTQQQLRNRLSYAGSRLIFTSERDDYWWWMMLNADANAFRLIEAMLDNPAWKDDLPRLVQGAMERQVQGKWLTTTANAWARVTLDAFARKFEKNPVTGKTMASLGKANAELDWRKINEPGQLPIELAWPNPMGRDDKLRIQHQGNGQPWATVQVLAAIPDGPARAMGYRVKRQVTPVEEKTAGKVSRGDLWRVTLTVDADVDMTWVALTDHIPAGARILGDGDGRDSAIGTPWLFGLVMPVAAQCTMSQASVVLPLYGVK
jgi:alpha-2-macroglobulin